MSKIKTARGPLTDPTSIFYIADYYPNPKSAILVAQDELVQYMCEDGLVCFDEEQPITISVNKQIKGGYGVDINDFLQVVVEFLVNECEPTKA